MLPKRWTEVKSAMDTNNDGELSEDEIDNAIKILQKTKNQQQNFKKEVDVGKKIPVFVSLLRRPNPKTPYLIT